MRFRDWMQAFRAARDWRGFGASWLAVPLVAVILGPGSDGTLNVIALYGPPVLAISLMGGLWEFAQRASVWTMLAQRPGTERARWWSLHRFCLATYGGVSAVMLAGLAAGYARNPEVASPALTMLSVTLWTAVVGAAVAFTSTIRPTRTAALSLVWLVSPFVLAVLRQAFEMPSAVNDALGFLVPPFDAAWDYARVVRGELPERAVTYSAQLLAFPVLCLLLVRWRIAVLSRPDRARAD